MLKVVVRRRWLYLSSSNLYSRPHVDVDLCTRESVYSRPRAESGGAQHSPLDVRNPVERISSISSTSFQVAIVQALPGVGRVPERSEGGWVLNRSFNPPVQNPHKKIGAASAAPPSRSPRSSRPPRNLEAESIGSCRGEAYSRIPHLAQSIVSDK